MLLEISLAGFASYWTFRGSGPFGAWAEARPWLREGGICVLRTESSEVGDLIIPSICRAVHGLNAGESRLDIRRVECGSKAGTPIQSMLREFELDVTISPFEAREKIRACLLDRSILLIFIESAAVDLNDWEALINLLEHYRKSTNPISLSALIVDGRGILNTNPICDFVNGRTTHHVLSNVSSEGDEAAHWPAYLHQRTVWEAGGSLGYATSLDGALENTVSYDDEKLEQTLQAHARIYFANHSGRDLLWQLIRVDTKAVQTTQDKRNLQRITAELRALNLLWRPPSMNSLHVVPWASRALLARPDLPKNQIWALRHHLVCAPLAGEILSLCLQFESQIQTKLHGKQSSSAISDQMINNQARFNSGEEQFVVYPNGFPAPPNGEDDIWAFATLGENLKSCPKNQVPQLYWDTLHLRNAVAHGHYVGWFHVRRALRMLRYFDN